MNDYTPYVIKLLQDVWKSTDLRKEHHKNIRGLKKNRVSDVKRCNDRPIEDDLLYKRYKYHYLAYTWKGWGHDLSYAPADDRINQSRSH
jgi:hypothetical protein